jgi:hypothetical protein
MFHFRHMAWTEDGGSGAQGDVHEPLQAPVLKPRLFDTALCSKYNFPSTQVIKTPQKNHRLSSLVLTRAMRSWVHD